MHKPFRALKEIYNPYAPYMPYKDRYDIQQRPDIAGTMGPVPRDEATLEAEQGEVALKPDLSGAYHISGKKHSQGGTPLNMDPGSFIFSNDKNLSFNRHEKKLFEFKKGGVTKTENTPARVLKREVPLKLFNRSNDIASDPRHEYDDIAKRSAGLMLDKYKEKLGQVAYVQESKKGFPTGVPDFAQNTAPVYNPEVKDDMEQDQQYFQTGGYFRNPYTPRMMALQIGGPYDRFGGKTYAEGGLSDVGDPNDILPGRSPMHRAAGPYDGPPDATGKWAGDYSASRNPKTGVASRNWNAMTDFKSPQDYAQAVGYPSQVSSNPQSIRQMQQWIMQKYPDVVNKYHSSSEYGMPGAGRPDDGMLGRRWNDIGNEIANPKLPMSFMANPPDPGAPASPTSTPAQPQAPDSITPNTFAPGTTLPYNPRIPLSPLQKANMLYAGYQAMSIPRYNPYRSQIKSPLVELNKFNAQPALDAVRQSAAQAYQANRAGNPYLQGTNNAEIFGKSLQAQQQVIGDYANRNVGVGNQQAEQNNQIQRQDLGFNTQANQRYYDQTQALNQNYNNEKRFATNQAVSLANNYVSQNQQLEQMLAQQRTYGRVQIGTDKNGNPLYQAKPLYDVDLSGISPHVYYTGAGSLTGIPNMGNRLQDIQLLGQQLRAMGMDPRSTAYGRVLGSAINSRNSLQMPYNYQQTGFGNPYGSGYGGGYEGGYKKGGMYGWMRKMYLNPYAHRQG